MRPIVWIAAALVAGGGALLMPWGGATASAAVAGASELFAVHAGDLPITLVETGTLVAKESKKVAARIRSESKVVWLIEEGKEVIEGEVVCRLDDAPAKKLVDEVQLEILQTEANLKTARTDLEIQGVENTANLRKAGIALDKAEKEVEKYRDGQAPQERRKLEVSLKDAETKFLRSKKKLDDSKKLLEQNYIKKSEYEDNELEFESASVQKESAQVELRLFDKYVFPMTLTDFETKLADGQREIQTTQKRGESQLGQKTVAVQQVEKRLAMLQAQLKERQEDLVNMTLVAPCPGLVVYGNPQEQWYRERVKVGSQVFAGYTVLTVPDLRVMQVRLQIHEADISKLRPGLSATITADTYPGMLLRGVIGRIASVANNSEDWGGSSEVKKFAVEVTIETKDLQLRPGISAKVEIHVDVRPHTLFVPLQSVFLEDGQHWCHVQPKGQAPRRRRITIGASNDNYLEVTEGLQEGELVLLYNPVLPPSAPSPTAEKDQPQPPPPPPAAAPPRKVGS